MTTAAHPGLADPLLWRQVESVIAIYSRGHRWLRDEFASACNLAVAEACVEWTPGRGMSFRSFATMLAHHRCQKTMEAERPRGFRRRHRVPPTVASLEGMAEARELDPADLAADPGPGPDTLAELAELVAVAEAALGIDAEAVSRWMGGEILEDIAADLGVSKQRVNQRVARGVIRAKKAMDRATRPSRDRGQAAPPARPGAAVGPPSVS